MLHSLGKVTPFRSRDSPSYTGSLDVDKDEASITSYLRGFRAAYPSGQLN